MRLFLRIVRLAIFQQTTYRMALIAGLVTNFFFGLFRAAVVVALYNGQTLVNGLTLRAALTYVAVGQGLIAFLYLFGTYDLMATVYSGAIAADLVRPAPLFFLWMGKDFGRSLVNLVGRGMVLVLVFSLFYPILVPTSLAGWLWTVVSLLLAWLTCFAWRFLVNLASFWTPDARGVARAAYSASQFFSGFILPMRLYPDWFASLCKLTPFPAMFNSGVEVYLGTLQGPALWNTLLIQAGWALVLALACHLALRAGLRRLVIQGG